MQRTPDVSGVPLLLAAHVEGHGAAVRCATKLLKRRDVVRRQPVLLATRPRQRRAGESTEWPVDADLGELPGRRGDRLVLAEEDDAGTGRKQPRQVGDQRAGRLDVDGTAEMLAGEVTARAKVDQPVTFVDAALQPVGVEAA